MTSRRFFDPESLALDIFVQDVQGLGKGKGFRSKGRRSILGRSDLVSKIEGRLLDLLELLYQRRLLSKEDVAQRLDISTGNEEALRAIIGERKRAIERLQDDIDAMGAEKEELVESLGKLIDDIQEALGFEWDSEDDDSLSRLRSGVQTLIEEYSALKVQEEEN